MVGAGLLNQLALSSMVYAGFCEPGQGGKTSLIDIHLIKHVIDTFKNGLKAVFFQQFWRF
jgi:hypothetical protein